MKVMPETKKLEQVIQNLKAANFIPVFAGGLALTLFGSDRVIFDIDIAVKRPDDLEEAKSLVRAMHNAGCYYGSKLDKRGTPNAYIENVNAAASRMMLDKPDSLFFWNQDLKKISRK